MSKRTTLYATYAKIYNDSGATRTSLRDNGVAVVGEFDLSAFQMGLKHAF